MPALRTAASPRRLGGRWAALAAATVALFGASLALAPAAVAAGGSIGAVTVSAPATADEGDTVTVTIPVDASTDLYAYDLVVTFDPALLDFDDASATFPAGGHDTVTETAGSVQLTHTRLGSSPGLTGAQTLATFTFTALGGGSAAIQLAGATFVDSTGGTIALPAPVTATVAVTAAPTAPTPGATGTPSPTATASPTATPAPSGSGPAASDPLVATGGDPTGVLVAGSVAAALLALGIVLVIRRRRGFRSSTISQEVVR
ncbi:cohesin domain-containing protein [Microbacterium telephonicum]|uniref:Cohesin domain-containing protein n=1 Tax=Microbacterium telephonicum TaxID=1714841 RepID=A0A498BYC7_9MICO|nr:cohesin domain-containing protein [Microbacterium telephonicum]RLK47983.1 cohesin domain-containing protein [Microbacterium telephonicum]